MKKIILFLLILPIAFALDQVEMSCDTDKDFYYPYERAETTCNLINAGSTALEDLQLCYGIDCTTVKVGAVENKDYILSLFPSKNPVITLEGMGVSEKEQLDFEYLTEPAIFIENLEYPENTGYDDKSKITFILNNKGSNPQNINLTLGELYSYSGEFEQGASFEIDLKGSDLEEGINTLELSITYNDKNERDYQTKDRLSITLNELNIWQKVKRFFSNLF